MPIRAVAIDFAGTLTTSGRRRPDGQLVRSVLHDEFDTEVPDGFVALFNASFWTRYVESLSSTLPGLLADTARETGMSLPDPDAVAAALWQACGDHPVDPVAADAVRALRDMGLTCVLASNTARPAKHRQATLEAAGLGFMTLVCSSGVGVAKPFEGFYHHVIRTAGVPAEEVAFVGDQVLNDVRAPMDAGMRAVWVNRRLSGEGRPWNLPGGILMVSHFSQLPGAIGPLLAS
ncbi:HAD family hydrolase (plasmid) [Streptomyces sp. NBC_00445]|uniref:HAD family hydrolase n=1 Tax=Streptomyces sp. NBC_00445 TaxID=2975745 RepID=UPI002E1F316E